MENAVMPETHPTDDVEVLTKTTPAEALNEQKERMDETTIDSELPSKTLDQRITESNLTTEQRISVLREKLGLIPKRISEWWNSKEGHPKTNILYRPDRMYRCIGSSGYNDFINTGIIGSKNKNKYYDVSFNIGEPASLYMEGSSGDFILEATPESTNFEFKINPYSLSGEPMKDIPYRSCSEGSLTKESAIRIFKRTTQNGKSGTYEVVFDNIGDQALIDSDLD